MSIRIDSCRAGAPSGVRVILFDTLNPIDARFARNQLASALHEYGSDEHLYLYFLTPLGLQPVRGLPHAHGGTPTISLDDVSVEQAYQNALKANVDSYGWDSANMTYRSLQSLASRLAPRLRDGRASSGSRGAFLSPTLPSCPNMLTITRGYLPKRTWPCSAPKSVVYAGAAKRAAKSDRRAWAY